MTSNSDPSLTTPAKPGNHQQRLFPVFERFMFAALMVAFSFILLQFGWTQRLDYIIYDSFLKWRPTLTTTSGVIVAIDEKSLSDLGRWPWDRTVHADLIQKLDAAGAEAVVFDILLTEADAGSADHELQRAMAASGNIILPMHIDHRSASGRMTEILPTPGYVAAATRLGHAHFELDEDGIARGLYLYQGLGDSHWSSLALAAFELIGSRSSPLVTRHDPVQYTRFPVVDFHSPADRQQQSVNAAAVPGAEVLNIREAYRLIPFIGPPGSFATLSYSDVLDSELPTDYFSGRVVFVGATAVGLGDFIATPVSGGLVNMSGVEVHANVFESLVKQNLTVLVSQFWQYFITLGGVFIIALIFPKLSPGKNMPLVLLSCVAVGLSSYLILLFRQHWFAPATLFITLLSAYPFWSWRRLLRLNRFLHQELERLADEPQLHPISSYHSAQQWAQHLVRLLKPELWEFRDCNLNGEPRIVLDDKQKQAEIYMPVQDRKKFSALYMKVKGEPEQLEVIAKYVSRLFPELHSKSPKRPAPGELIDRRILQVRRAIATMRDMRQFISDTVAKMPDGVLVCDQFGRIMFLNEPARHWLKEGAQSGSFIADFMPVSNRVSQSQWEIIVRNVLLREESKTEELHMENHAVLTTLVPINFTHNKFTGQYFSNDSRGLVITFSDITVIHEAQHKRLETIHFVSHDLRAPLASQLALLDTLKTSLPSECEEKLAAAQRLTEKSLAMADQFLQLARIESADHIHLYECELLDVVDNAVDATSPLAQATRVKLNTSSEVDSLIVCGNPELLERSLINLIQNAIKFSADKSSIDIHIRSTNTAAVVLVQDYGQGIEPKELPCLFDSYRRTRASEQQGIAGSGLGLRFVKLVADRHGGQIKVTSTPGEGACFSLFLPLQNTLPKINNQRNHQEKAL